MRHVLDTGGRENTVGDACVARTPHVIRHSRCVIGTMMPYDPDKHHRRSVRLAGYDYSQAGAYFVTIVARGRECLFGDVVGAEMRVNEYGEIARACWLATITHFPDIELDEFIVMPNHIHGIIAIVGATHASPSSRTDASHTDNNVKTPWATHASPLPPRLSPHGPSRRSVGAIVGSYKSAVTRRVNALRGISGAAVWQRNYHDRIIRDDDELNRTREYIEINPARWAEDEENPHGAQR